MSEQDPYRRFYLNAGPPSPTAGQLLYEAFCGSRQSDEARYFRAMNPALRRRWETLGEEVRANVSEDAWDLIVHMPERGV
jgi:hypothetical protein